MNFRMRLIALIPFLAITSGCVGILMDSIDKSVKTGDTYGELVSNIPLPTSGKGRLYIYRTESSTKHSLALGYGIAKNPTYCTVDDVAYEIIWEVFRYIDLPNGQHEITCGDDTVADFNPWSGKRKFRRGVNKLQLSVSGSGSEEFVRVDSTTADSAFTPVKVSVQEGKAEIANLPLQDDPGSEEFIKD